MAASDCKLLNLPPELRNRIYSHLFPEDAVTTIDATYTLPGILITCRQIHNEAIKLYYASTTFYCTSKYDGIFSRIFYNDPRPDFAKWYTNLPPTYANLIPKFRYMTLPFADHIEKYGCIRMFGPGSITRNLWEAKRRFAELGINRGRIEVPWLLEESWVWTPLETLRD